MVQLLIAQRRLDERRVDDDDRFAHGLTNGCLLGLALWGCIAAALWWWLR